MARATEAVAHSLLVLAEQVAAARLILAADAAQDRARELTAHVKDLFPDWEDKWWPKPMARGQRAAVPACRPQSVAAE